jgi:hypothetical protein
MTNPNFDPITVSRSVFILRLIWFSTFVSGFIIAMVIPAITLEREVQYILFGFSAVFTILSFAVPYFLSMLTKAEKRPEPNSDKTALQNLMLSHILRLTLLESALLTTLIGTSDQIENSRVYIIVAFSALLASQFPSSIAANPPRTTKPPQS